MFKKMLVCFVFLFCVLLSGCARESRNFLEYQTMGFETKANVDINGDKYNVTIKKSAENKVSIAFEEPARLKGTSLEIEDNKLFYCVGRLRLPIPDIDHNKIANLMCLFELSKENIVSNKIDLLNGVKVNIINFKQQEGSVILYLATDTNIPLRIEADINGNSITINLSEFTVL